MRNEDSSPVPFDAQHAGRKRLTFDPTINAGHILTFLGMLFALFAGWTSLDKRVLTLELSDAQKTQRDTTQDSVIKEKFDDIKTSVREVQQSLNEMRRQQNSK